jgi:hypothetical protein
MNQAKRIIKKFGGQTALAKLIGKRQSTVQHWCKVGTIPAKWHSKLMEVANQHDVTLIPSDFVPVSEEKRSVSALPIARWPGVLRLSEEDELPCYVLDDGRRVISRTGATQLLTGGKGGGNLESYIRTQAIGPHIPDDLPDRMIEFVITEVTNKTVRGLTAEDFLLICKAYVVARDKGILTEKQTEIAIKAGMFLSACAKVGLIALIDEATGYQYIRRQDALQVKLKLFLEEEMRKWEKTFPDELWLEFGRLTKWQGPIHSRPKYWGKLVAEIIYEYLDPDVAEWLRTNVPEPRHGRNYHQWLSSQYGLQRLVQHIWMVIGMSKTCFNIQELREKVGLQFGREQVQFSLFLPPPSRIAGNIENPGKMVKIKP